MALPLNLSFNPHPPSLAGEALAGEDWQAAHAVSIHTRHHWRVKRKAAQKAEREAEFQSTPAITGG